MRKKVTKKRSQSKKRKIHKYVRMYVEWLDSTVRKQSWWDNKELLDETDKVRDRFQTVGYLVNENKREYIFAASIHFEEGKAVSFCFIYSIPKGCVTKMTKI